MENLFRILGVLLCAFFMIGFGVCGAFGLFNGISFDFQRMNAILIFFGLAGLGISALIALLMRKLIRRIAGRDRTGTTT